MANSLEQQIISVLNNTRDQIRANMEREGVNASGRTSASIRVVTGTGVFALVGGYNSAHGVQGGDGITAGDTAPIPTLEVGRKGGGNPPVPRGFYYIIREWTRVKGLSFASETERNTFSYFLSRKIAREGTERHEHNKDIYSTPVNNARTVLMDIFRGSLQNTIRAALGRAQVTSLKGAFTQ